MTSESKMETNRISWIDMAKGYGILAVFTGHIVQGTVVGDFVYSFHLPLFFFISGYLFNATLPFGKFMAHKLKSIILPYFVLGLPIVFFAAYYPLVFARNDPMWLPPADKLGEALVENLFGFVFQVRYATLWYLAVLFFLNIVMYILTRVPYKPVHIIIVIAMAVAGLGYYGNGGSWLPWNVDVVMTAIPFFYVGYFIRQYDIVTTRLIPLKALYKLGLWAVFMAINIGANIMTFSRSGSGLEMYQCSYGVPGWTYLSAFAGICGVIVFSTLFDLKPINYIGEHSMLFFLWHQAIFFEFWKYMYPRWGIPDVWRFIGNARSPLELYVGMTLLILAQIIPTCLIIWGLVELLRRTPLRRMV